ncbi:MAG: hypothetical protein HC872_05260 [Gammaproteobacteria bacterium]|nr:hypothetical protein [Gammaproteobacteria bacterium]
MGAAELMELLEGIGFSIEKVRLEDILAYNWRLRLLKRRAARDSRNVAYAPRLAFAGHGETSNLEETPP